MVYVLDIEGKPLMPTVRHGKVRRLLRDEKAHVVRLMPFTIQLDYESKRFIQEVSLGIDAGSVHIGVSATTEKKELFAAEVVMRNDIVKKISDRAELRRTRRCVKIRYRVSRHKNRKNYKGRIAPSVKYKIESHLKVIRLLYKILPVYKTSIEVAQFDSQKMKDDKIQGIEYQHGEQLGFWNVREYVLARDGHKCQHCKGKSGDKILNVHHLESRKTGGNAPNNLITLCETCHNAYHRGEFELKIKRGTSLRDTAVMNIMRWEVYNQAKKELKNVHLTYGYITKHIRIKNNIAKSHCTDAFCITKNIKAIPLFNYLVIRSLRRHNRSLSAYKPLKRGVRKRNVTSHWIGQTKFQRNDSVVWNNIKCFIYGSSHGYGVVLRDIDGKLVTPKLTVNVKYITFVNRNKGYLMQQINKERYERIQI